MKRRRHQPTDPERSMNIHMQPGSFTSTHSVCSARKPSIDRAEIISRTVEVHIRNGNWAMARNTLATAEREFNSLARTPAQWLDATLYEFALPHRGISILEAAGIYTMREALTFLNTGAQLDYFGPMHGEEIWRAARAKGIDFERSAVASAAAAEQRQRDLHLARVQKKKAQKARELELQETK